MKVPSRWLLLAALSLVPSAALGQGAVPFIGTDELKRVYDSGEDFVLADALSPIEFAEERIARSVNVPVTALRTGKAKLPADRSRRLVFYCKGPK